LKVLAWAGLVWDLKMPSAAVLRNEHHLGSRVIDRAAAQLAASFNADLIVSAITTACAGPSLVALQEKLAQAQHRAADVLATWHLPQLPTRHDLLARARAMFAETPSMEDIVNRAHAVILDRIGARLSAAVAA
jgi:stearoyl-CoA desaturase (delta-9 desaturase)